MLRMDMVIVTIGKEDVIMRDSLSVEEWFVNRDPDAARRSVPDCPWGRVGMAGFAGTPSGKLCLGGPDEGKP